MKRRLKFQNAFCVDPRGLLGGLCLLWKKSVDIQILQASPYFINTVVNKLKNFIDFDCILCMGIPNFKTGEGYGIFWLVFRLILIKLGVVLVTLTIFCFSMKKMGYNYNLIIKWRFSGASYIALGLWIWI